MKKKKKNEKNKKKEKKERKKRKSIWTVLYIVEIHLSPVGWVYHQQINRYTKPVVSCCVFESG